MNNYDFDSLIKQCPVSLISRLKELGFSEEEAKKQSLRMAGIILLSTVIRLANEKNLDLSEINQKTSEAKLAFLKENFSDEELSQALLAESEMQIQNYLKVLDPKNP